MKYLLGCMQPPGCGLDMVLGLRFEVWGLGFGFRFWVLVLSLSFGLLLPHAEK